MKRRYKRHAKENQKHELSLLEGSTSLPKRPYVAETMAQTHRQDPRNRRRARERAEAKLAPRLHTSSETE
ncbi:hypothetical protein Y032_0008g322 [Ancylostoma ceylanicum]|uniref:Uncharacterized protein n=1 Tax=Ancylostoma ceylanicum TaxID=53326 RepID=A0A016VKH3_9BILA|nr:hypothetical protein Y032_0008g322 [Ancylostoma ceylanicum]